MFTLIDFHAEWCGPCHVLEPILDKLMPSYAGKISLEKVDVDREPEKSQQFGVMSIPTLVLMQDGKEVDRTMGAVPEPTLKQWLDSHL